MEGVNVRDYYNMCLRQVEYVETYEHALSSIKLMDMFLNEDDKSELMEILENRCKIRGILLENVTEI